MRQGPPIQRLTYRLSECPPEFLSEPLIGRRGQVHTRAVVADLMAALGAPLWAEEVFEKLDAEDIAQRNWLRVVLVASWLLHDPWFRAKDRKRSELDGEVLATRAFEWLLDGLDAFAGLVAAEACVENPDRREELARRCLLALGLTPEDESEEQSQDRLATLDCVAQHRILYDTRGRLGRAERLRKQMEDEELARQAAARASRE